MPNLLNHLAAPNCPRLGSTWDRCEVHYVEPIEGAAKRSSLRRLDRAPALTTENRNLKAKLRYMELHYQDAIAKAGRFGSNKQMFGAK
jgi:hypothetical protein